MIREKYGKGAAQLIIHSTLNHVCMGSNRTDSLVFIHDKYNDFNDINDVITDKSSKINSKVYSDIELFSQMLQN